MSVICILLEFLGWLKSGMSTNYAKTLRMIQSLKIKWLACLRCFLVCTFGSPLAPVLLLAHTIHNLHLGDEQGHENEGYKSD